jgi:hypothetical protein
VGDLPTDRQNESDERNRYVAEAPEGSKTIGWPSELAEPEICFG